MDNSSVLQAHENAPFSQLRSIPSLVLSPSWTLALLLRPPLPPSPDFVICHAQFTHLSPPYLFAIAKNSVSGLRSSRALPKFAAAVSGSGLSRSANSR